MLCMVPVHRMLLLMINLLILIFAKDIKSESFLSANKWKPLMKIKTGSSRDGIAIMNLQNWTDINDCGEVDFTSDVTDSCISTHLKDFAKEPPLQVYLALRNRREQLIAFIVLRNDRETVDLITWLEEAEVISSSGISGPIISYKHIFKLSSLTEGFKSKQDGNIEYHFDIEFTTLYHNKKWYNILKNKKSSIKATKHGGSDATQCYPDDNNRNNQSAETCEDVTSYGSCFTCCLEKGLEVALIKLSSASNTSSLEEYCQCYPDGDSAVPSDIETDQCTTYDDCRDTDNGYCMFIFHLTELHRDYFEKLLKDYKGGELDEGGKGHVRSEDLVSLNYDDDGCEITTKKKKDEKNYYVFSMNIDFSDSVDLIVTNCTWKIRYWPLDACDAVSPKAVYDLIPEVNMERNGCKLNFKAIIRVMCMKVISPCMTKNNIKDIELNLKDGNYIYPYMLELHATSGNIDIPDEIVIFDEDSYSTRSQTSTIDGQATSHTLDQTTAFHPFTGSIATRSDNVESHTVVHKTDDGNTITAYAATVTNQYTPKIDDVTTQANDLNTEEIETSPNIDYTSAEASTILLSYTEKAESMTSTSTFTNLDTIFNQTTNSFESTEASKTLSPSATDSMTFTNESATSSSATKESMTSVFDISTSGYELEDISHLLKIIQKIIRMSPDFLQFEIANDTFLCKGITKEVIHQTSVRDIQEEITQMTKNLTVVKSSLSASIRRKISAVDNRPSAHNIGYLALIILGCELGLIVLLDISYLFEPILNLCRKYNPFR